MRAHPTNARSYQRERERPKPVMPSPEAALPEINERRCPYCKSERVSSVGHLIASGGMIKVEYRCDVCGTAFLIVEQAII
jgi:DNA-directed RNA polymerase subunit RPC12/RpoP